MMTGSRILVNLRELFVLWHCIFSCFDWACLPMSLFPDFSVHLNKHANKHTHKKPVTALLYHAKFSEHKKKFQKNPLQSDENMESQISQFLEMNGQARCPSLHTFPFKKLATLESHIFITFKQILMKLVIFTKFGEAN